MDPVSILVNPDDQPDGQGGESVVLPKLPSQDRRIVAHLPVHGEMR